VRAMAYVRRPAASSNSNREFDLFACRNPAFSNLSSSEIKKSMHHSINKLYTYQSLGRKKRDYSVSAHLPQRQPFRVGNWNHILLTVYDYFVRGEPRRECPDEEATKRLPTARFRRGSRQTGEHNSTRSTSSFAGPATIACPASTMTR
jgi:hypothetical protein